MTLTTTLLIGTDAINGDRIPPYTGGSRMIQDGWISPSGTRTLGITLLTFCAALGACRT
ncbi:hypothetical protein [Thioalkalivibrio sulfidiphilus]|uniref:hypothetical protein n=1 Tax=Thioalkalivibrio sulfidiphilus TaxID=1033854 RepID=UPI00164FA2A2|nr:hypothetical protein [Thioalkalivibrio sulfidiphilus]